MCMFSLTRICWSFVRSSPSSCAAIVVFILLWFYWISLFAFFRILSSSSFWDDNCIFSKTSLLRQTDRRTDRSLCAEDLKLLHKSVFFQNCGFYTHNLFAIVGSCWTKSVGKYSLFLCELESTGFMSYMCLHIFSVIIQLLFLDLIRDFCFNHIYLKC